MHHCTIGGTTYSYMTCSYTIKLTTYITCWTLRQPGTSSSSKTTAEAATPTEQRRRPTLRGDMEDIIRRQPRQHHNDRGGGFMRGGGGGIRHGGSGGGPLSAATTETEATLPTLLLHLKSNYTSTTTSQTQQTLHPQHITHTNARLLLQTTYDYRKYSTTQDGLHDGPCSGKHELTD